MALDRYCRLNLSSIRELLVLLLRVASPATAYGSAVPRPSATEPATTRVGQHTFVLEDTPGSALQRAKMVMQRQQQGSGGRGFTYAHARSSTPTRSRKEERSPPQN